ncbi:zinc transporter 1 [Silurus asotus]|uniref:Zinc transporter 1 n=1 Tax=Silurus asotus TaxID=30991 RepID=A0AAD5FIE2_SILAS|nr:zinc transporter 1 [Silurus asotus]
MALDPKQARLLCMLCLTFGFFVLEVVVSRVTGSLAMLSDSFHMLSDVIALLVALLAVRLATQTAATSLNTFGWIRAEVMGALVNAVFLTALCFTILMEAVERFTEPQEIEKPRVVVWVGVAGLVVNVLGLLMFHGYAGHGHSHSTSNKKYEKPEPSEGETYNLLVKTQCPGPGDHAVQVEADITSKSTMEIPLNANVSLQKPEPDLDSSAHLNMRGVFLHVLGDALGSVIVVVNALIFTYVWQSCDNREKCVNLCINNPCAEKLPVNNHLILSNGTSAFVVAGPCWVLYLDPILCIIMVGILLYTTFPLLKESTLILLQSVPKQVDIQRLNKKLRSLDGVLAVHELHIWQLAGSRIIATAHVKCHDPVSYMDTAKRIKSLFHEEGIHATTVQPEFSDNKVPTVSECELPCYSQCTLKLCCDKSWKSGSESLLVYTDDSSSPHTPQHSTASWNIRQNPDVFLQTELESTV